VLAYSEKRVVWLDRMTQHKRNFPLGSGVMESLIQRVLNLRLKGNSIFWKPEKVEHMQALRTYFKVSRCAKVIQQVIVPLSPFLP
jgi:hypothetical protein